MLIAVSWSLIERSDEPRYQGKRVSFWFKEYIQSRTWRVPATGPSYQQGAEAMHRQSAAALRHFGTNAVPYLIEQSFNTRQVPAIRREIDFVLNSLPVSWGLPPFVDPGVMCEQAPEALKEIKPPAAMLLRLMSGQLESTNVLQRTQALYVLGTAGDGAEQLVPYLVSALHRPAEAGFAVQSLDWIGPQASNGVSALVEAINSTNNVDGAVHALGSIGSAAAPAIPLIKGMFEKEAYWNRRNMFAAALCKIDASQTEALSFLMDGLTNHQPASDRWIPAFHLGDIGANARAAAPALLQSLALATNDSLFAFAATNALKKLAP